MLLLSLWTPPPPQYSRKMSNIDPYIPLRQGFTPIMFLLAFPLTSICGNFFCDGQVLYSIKGSTHQVTVGVIPLSRFLDPYFFD